MRIQKNHLQMIYHLKLGSTHPIQFCKAPNRPQKLMSTFLPFHCFKLSKPIWLCQIKQKIHIIKLKNDHFNEFCQVAQFCLVNLLSKPFRSLCDLGFKARFNPNAFLESLCNGTTLMKPFF